MTMPSPAINPEMAAARSTLIDAFEQLWSEPALSSLSALLDDERSYAYGVLHDAVGAQAGWLHEQRIRPGDRIARTGIAPRS
jgi:hypothetical protein